MKRRVWICCVGAVGGFAAAVLWMPLKDVYQEVDLATGSVRVRQIDFGLFERQVRIKPSWIELRAKELGIAFTRDWQPMSRQSETCLTWFCGLGRYRRVPAQLEPVGNIDATERDNFMRNYLHANREVRLEMLEAWQEGNVNEKAPPEAGGATF